MSGYTYVNQTGTVVADTSDVLAGVQSEWKAAFGEDLDVDPSTPQGVMITAETTARVAVMQALAQVANQLNPNLAGGVFLDAICALMQISREAASYTLVTNVKMTGQPNATIPAGVLAGQGTSGPQFMLLSGVTLDGVTGIGYGTFQAVIAGPTACASGALNTPVTAYLGWETVTNDQSDPTNPSSTTLGALVQTDASLRVYRNETLANQGISTVQAQVSNLYALPGVLSVSFRENVAGTTQTIDGISLVGHSVWACVDGGSNIDIATALLNNKTDGAAWNGAVSVPVLEPYSGQTYTVLFDRPTYVPIFGSIAVSQGIYTGNLDTDARQAVVDYFAGNVDGFAKLGNGDDVSPFAIAAAVMSACPGCIVTMCQIGTTSGGPYSAADIAIAINQRATTNLTSFSVTVS